MTNLSYSPPSLPLLLSLPPSFSPSSIPPPPFHQDIIKNVCSQMDIPPMARVFFALCIREKGIPFSPLSPYRRLSRQEGRKKYQLRVFVNVENSNYLQHVSPAAHSYYYEQVHPHMRVCVFGN